MVLTRSMSHGTAQLLDLPAELFNDVLARLDPVEVLNVALTCHAAHNIAKSRLAKQPGLYAKYRLQHDRSPMTMLELLRHVTAGDDTAFHVRDLELWCYRDEWDAWTTPDSWNVEYNDHDEEHLLEPSEDCRSMQDVLPNSKEWKTYEKMVTSLCPDQEDADDWIEKLQDGWEEPLKALLISFAPAMRSVKFVQYDSWQSGSKPHPLGLLNTAIDNFTAMSEPIWPSGLWSLSCVTVCSTSSLKHPHDMYYCKAYEIVPLFKLPNIKTLHLNLVGASDDGEDNLEFDLPANSSSIEELALYICDFEEADLETIFAAPRALRRLFWESAGKSVHNASKLLQKYQSDSIEYVRFDFSSSGLARDDVLFDDLYRNLPLKRIESFPLGLAAKGLRGVRAKEDDSEITVSDLRDYLPVSLETLAIESFGSQYGKANPYRYVQQSLCSRLLELVSDKRFSALKEICLSSAFSYYSFDTNLVKPLLEKGINVHLPDTQNKEWDGEGREDIYENKYYTAWHLHRAKVHGVQRDRLTPLFTDPRLKPGQTPWDLRY